MKDLFKESAPNDVLQSSFNDFVFSSISYFKITDASELMQEEYQSVESNEKFNDNDIDISTLDQEMLNVAPKKAH